MLGPRLLQPNNRFRGWQINAADNIQKVEHTAHMIVGQRKLMMRVSNKSGTQGIYAAPNP